MKKNKNDMRVMVENGKILEMNENAYNYVISMKNRLQAVEDELMKRNNELEIIKPVLETNNIKPAISRHCGDCKYVIKSRWDGTPIACNKDCVCSDFYPREDR